MKQTSHTIFGYKVCLTRKPIRHIYLRINRETSELRVSAPPRVGLGEIESFIRLKKSWIEKRLQQAQRLSEKIVTSFEDGKRLLYRGQPYLLRIAQPDKIAKITELNQELIFHLPATADPALKHELFLSICTEYLNSVIPDLLNVWQQRIGVSIKEWRLKTMKTRWGSCNIQEKRIWLNRNLGHYGIEEIEFVIVHELLHLLERYHNERFYGLMDRFLPDWRLRKKKLSAIIYS